MFRYTYRVNDLKLWRVVFNAIKYCNLNQKQPKVIISVKYLQNLLVVSISDNRQGIKEEHIEKVFNMFYRAHLQCIGTGLGLFIVQETIDKMGGSIDINSIFGLGTSFIIKVPFGIGQL